DDGTRDRAVPITCQEGVYRSIAPLGDSDWFALDVPERSSVTIQGYTPFSLNVALQDARGRDLEYEPYGSIVRGCGVNALAAGHYFIELSAPYGPTFAYDLLVTCSPCNLPNPPTAVPPTRTPTPTPLVPDRYEPDDDPAAAQTIACGTLQPHSLDNPYDQDWVTFTLDKDSAVSVFAGVNL